VSLMVAGSLLTSDGFVARYHGDGSLAWVKQFGGAAGSDQGVAIAAAADGSCVVTGTFAGTATFGEGSNQVVLDSVGGVDVFVARYDGNGNLLWARRGGGPGDDQARGIGVLSTGACIACGGYSGTATFGTPTDFGALQSVGMRDAYVTRFADDGALTWVRSAGGASDDDARGIALAEDGACTITGSFTTLATFGTAPSTRNLAAYGLRDVFVARYDANGTLAWAKHAGGTNHDLGNGVALLPDGSCALTGSFQNAATFGAGSGAVLLTAEGFADLFIARLNADGDY
jgi:hypothetical protein